ncbi:MAG: sporulation protein YunB [Corallococcus sp.]|nr:sporulation protein YunB [Corallococcus sp.]
MAYYVKKEPKYKKKPKRAIRTKKLLIIFITITEIVSLFLLHLHLTRPIIETYAQSEVRSVTTKACNAAAYNVMTQSVKYSDLVTVEKNSDNEITLIQANTVLINSIARDTAQKVQTEINKFASVGISIPLGTLSGIALFSGGGPDICFTVKPIDSVVCTFVSEFKSAGINQTLHKISLIVSSKVNVILPTSMSLVDCSVPILISESLIIGKVPSAYLSGAVLGSSQSL